MWSTALRTLRNDGSRPASFKENSDSSAAVVVAILAVYELTLLY